MQLCTLHSKQFLILPQHPLVIQKLTGVIGAQSTSSSKAQNSTAQLQCLPSDEVSQSNLRLHGLSNFAGSLLCAWKVKQLLNPSAFPQVKKKKRLEVQDSLKRYSTEMRNISNILSSHLQVFSPGPSNNVCQMSKKEECQFY